MWQDDLTIFRLHTVDGARLCGCGNPECRDAGKHPAVLWSQLTAGQKERWPEGHPGGHGIATGERSGIVVVDLDIKPGVDGIAAWNALGGGPDTYTVQTGGGGLQLYYKWPGFRVKTSAGEIGPGIDIRGDGGFVVAPGSPHRSGGTYVTLRETEPVDLPAWLQARIHAPLRAQRTDICDVVPVTGDELSRRTEMGRKWLVTAQPSISGQGGHEALWRACLHLVRRLELPLDTAHQLLAENFNGRCLPPWSEPELIHKLEDARDKGQTSTGVAPDWFAKTDGAAEPSDGIPAAVGKLQAIGFSELCQTLYSHPDWEGVLRFNVLKRQPVALHPPIPMRMSFGAFSDGDVGRIRLWLGTQGYAAKAEDIKQAVRSVYEMPEQAYNPVVEYLDGLSVPEDGVTELDGVHETILNSPDGGMASQIFKKQMVAAVRRIRAMPGLHQVLTPVDHRVVVVFDGPQEAGKTSLLRLLGGEWYASLKGDVHDPDTRVALQGSWIVEIEEMISTKKSDREANKAFISATVDNDRAKYAASAERVQRSYVLFGTGNDVRFDDPSGSTRFATLRVGKMNQEAAERLRDRLWSEANQLCLAGYSHYLTKEEKEWTTQRNVEFEVEDSLAEQLTDLLTGVPFVTLREAYLVVAGDKAERFIKRTDENRFVETLRRIGCKQVKIQGKRGWLVPKDISTRPSKPSATIWLQKDDLAQKVRTKLVEN